RSVAPWAAGAALAALALAGAWFLHERTRVAAAGAGPGAAEKSVAVLAFADLSEKHDQEYFSDGLAEELLDTLAQIPELRVAARTSSFYFKQHPATVAEIARTLGVAHVLEGSVRKAGASVRVSVQLIRADDGFDVWARTFDTDVKDVFRVQHEIATAVAGALQARLQPPAHPAGQTTTSPEAHDEYLIGLRFSNQATLDGFRRAAAAYRRAIGLDRGYAAAYAGLAYAEANIADLTKDVPTYESARAQADEALRLDPASVVALSVRGYVRIAIGHDWAGSTADFERATALDPASPMVQRDYGFLLACLGRVQEAVALARRSVAGDPLSDDGWSHLGLFLAHAGDYAAARTALERGLTVHPESDSTRYQLAIVDLLEGHADQALALAPAFVGDVGRLLVTAMAQHDLGHEAESRVAIDRLLADHGQDGAYDIATMFAWRGDRERALEWLERAYRQRDSSIVLAKVDPLLRPLRREARFGAVLANLGLAS
ncbi:MAG: hypothetical protein JSR54_04385, partial [Proteobacteria bacterium]|nr:hypothetical protein [Pseudomonadota bacterium]